MPTLYSADSIRATEALGPASLHRFWDTPNRGGARTQYSESDRALAFACYADTGNIAEASRVANVPKSTLFQWLNADGADEALEQLRTALRTRVGFAYAELAAKAMRCTMDRLNEGDPHVLADGRVVFVPVKARDASMIAAIATDKHALITGMLENKRAVDKQLHGLAAKLLERLSDSVKPASEPLPLTPAADAFLG